MGSLLEMRRVSSLLKRGVPSRLLERVRNESVVYRHVPPPPAVEQPRESVTVEWVTADLIEETISDDRRRQRFLSFLDHGYCGLLAHDDGSWIAHGWVYTPESTLVPIHLPDWIGEMDLYWLVFGRTRAGYRERGWHTYLLARRLRAIYEHDPSETVFSDTGADNVSRYSLTSTGFEPAGTMVTYSLGYPPFDLVRYGRWDWETPHPPLPE